MATDIRREAGLLVIDLQALGPGQLTVQQLAQIANFVSTLGSRRPDIEGT